MFGLKSISKKIKDTGMDQRTGWNVMFQNLGQVSIDKQRELLNIGANHPDIMISAKSSYLLSQLNVEEIDHDELRDIFSALGVS